MLAIAITISVLFLTMIFVATAGRWRHFLFSKTRENEVSPKLPPQFVSLFAPDAKVLAEIEGAQRRREIAENTDRLLAWASLIGFSELAEMPVAENKKISDDALEILTDRAATDEDICALVRFVLYHSQLNVNQKLTRKFQLFWESSPDLKKTIQLFEIAVRADDAPLFQSVFVAAEQFIETGKLSDLTKAELCQLAMSHFWLLSPNARMSGSGFWLKQKLHKQ